MVEKPTVDGISLEISECPQEPCKVSRSLIDLKNYDGTGFEEKAFQKTFFGEQESLKISTTVNSIDDSLLWYEILIIAVASVIGWGTLIFVIFKYQSLIKQQTE